MTGLVSVLFPTIVFHDAGMRAARVSVERFKLRLLLNGFVCGLLAIAGATASGETSRPASEREDVRPAYVPSATTGVLR